MGTIARIAPIAALGLVATTACSQNNEARKPNIIFILADDMGYECVGAYGAPYNTPRLDKMAEEGILFNYAYSQPLSTPTRVQVMTGRYNYKNYVEFGFLNQDQKTFGNLAQMAGYKTAIVGKWQLGANSKLPAHFGFDNYCLWQLNYRRSADGERYADALVEADGKVLDKSIDKYGPDMFIEYIEDFIGKNKNEPFLLYYPMALVHDPFTPTPDSEEWADPTRRKERDAHYFADMMEYCDKNVGRIIDKLKKEGLYDNTLIIFTGDNGTNKAITTTMKDGRKIQGGKGLTTDAGTHVALIATYGDRQGKPGQCNDLADLTDIMPTMAEAMGIGVPAEWDTDGVSYLPQIMGKKGTPRKFTMCHYDSFFGGWDKPIPGARRYVRNHDYKLYSTGEFYHVAGDVLEENDIAPGTGSKEAEQSRAALAAEMAKLPPWKVGDIPVKKVELPELKVKQKTWTNEES